MRKLALGLMMATLIAGNLAALQAGDDLWVPAAARGQGNAGSFWVTDLTVMNLEDEELTVVVTWLVRGEDNSDALEVPIDIGAGETLVLEDVVMETFGFEQAAGAIRVTIEEDEEKAANMGASDGILASARIYNSGDEGTFGQGFDALVLNAAIAAQGKAVTHVVGVRDDSAFRSNWFGLNVTEDRDGDPEGAEVMVEVLTTDGDVLASETFTMEPLETILHPVSMLGAGDLEHATLRFTMLQGSGLFGASTVDMSTNDPVTLAAEWSCAACDVVPGSGDSIEDAKLYIEFNSTDDDIGVHGLFDDHGWSQLCVFGPDGGQVLSIKPQNQLADLTMAGIFFESREPPGSEFSFEDLQDEFPEGEYTVLGVTFEGKKLSGSAVFTHDVPAPPVITAPVLVEDEEDAEDAEVAMEGLSITWQPVTTTVDGEPLTATGYEVIITDEFAEDPNGFARPLFDVHVAPNRSGLSVPIEFLEPDTVYELEVLAIEESGNQTISVGFFKTE